MCEGKWWGVGVGVRRICYVLGEGWGYACIYVCVGGEYAYICVCGRRVGVRVNGMCGRGKVCVRGCLCERRGWYAYLCMYAGGRWHACT